MLGSGGGKKTNKQKTPDPFSFTYSTTVCGRYKYEKDLVDGGNDHDGDEGGGGDGLIALK